jgi:WXG100 family type VII secretion target
MNDIVQVDYEELEGVAARFHQQSGAVEQMHGSLLRAYNGLRDGGWVGRGAEAFFAEMDNEALPAVRRLVDVLTSASETTRQVSAAFQGADQEASSPFQSIGALGAAAWGRPADWLSGISGSLRDYVQGNYDASGLPRNWQTEPEGAAGGGSGGGSGGGTGGGSGSGGERSTQPASAGGGSGSRPQTGVRDPYSRVRPFSRAASSSFSTGGGTEGSSPGPGRLRYQVLSGAGGAGSPSAGGSFRRLAAPAGSAAPTQANVGGGLGLPMGLAAAVSPFVALLGKAIKDRSEQQ